METKSPFLVQQELISPLLCEQIIDNLEWYVPDTNIEGHPIKSLKHHNSSQQLIFEKVEPLISTFEEHYGFNYAGTEEIEFEWFPEGSSGELRCENSNYLRKKWVRTKNRDLCCIVFLSDYRDKPPFDEDYEVYGGKLEFPQHGFGFNPRRGTMIVFPSVPHFINATTEVQVGDLYQARIHISAQEPYLYDPKKFPGDYREWLKHLD